MGKKEEILWKEKMLGINRVQREEKKTKGRSRTREKGKRTVYNQEPRRQ